MHRELYTHQRLAAVERKTAERERALQRLVAAAPRSRRSFTQRTARWLGGLLLHLGTRLMAYGVQRTDTRTGVDLRYS